MVAFPMIKLVSLAMKQVSKPLAKRIQSLAKRNNFLRRYICMPPAQLHHWLEINLKMRSLGLGNPKKVERLSEDAAVELGAEMLGEGIVFSVAVGTIVFEYWRQSKKDEQHEDIQTEGIKQLNERVSELEILLEQQDARIREMNRIVVALPTGSSSKR
ncbi:optic atrophy 3 protein homolog [Anneissia japonica]|uniref:optic atrophy 3 protein homolog n=1 Tax=Anneissia japonica TaxID=1529436 RepID=UPI00142552EB|nr:optic atrophy 3 protein homolog [Anneissia japonica]